MKKYRLCTFLVISTLFCEVHASVGLEYNAIMRQATIYEEAGMLDESIAIYQELLKRELTSDQQNFLLYDIGTLYLEKHDYDKAIEVFSGVKGENQSPLLMSRLNRNLGIAYYSKAIQILKGESRSLEEMKEILYDLRSALRAFAEEASNYCDMQKIDAQSTPCQPSNDLLQLQNAVKVEIASLQNIVIKEGADDLPLEEEIPWLFDSINELIIELDFIEQGLEPTLKPQYIKLFTSAQPSWQPLWDASESKLVNNVKNEEAIRLFAEAKTHYNSGLQNFRNDQLTPARQDFMASKHHLSELMKLLYEQDPLRLNLYRILGMYQRIAANTTFTEAQLENIKEAYSQLHETMTPAFKELLKKSEIIETTLKSSQEHLNSGLSTLKEHKHSAANLYVLTAMSEVQDVLFDLKNTSPEGLLERILFQQNFALKSNGRTMQLPSEEISGPLLKLPIEAQEKVLLTVAKFWKTVRNQQIEKFQKEGLCQSSPWGTTLPLFEKGSQFAIDAMNNLNIYVPDAAKALTAQMNAVDAWQITLAELKNPHENPRSGCHQGPSSSQESDQKSEAPQNQLLQSLQQMYLDDHPTKKETPAVKSGERPW